MLYELLIPQSQKMLRNLKVILKKGEQFAESKKVEMSVLLQSRLAPDQFPLIKQVQIVTDTAKLAASRLTGKEAPKHDDQETTLAELNTRIDDVLNYLSSFSTKDFEGSEDRKISQPRWEGKYLTGVNYAHQHTLPNLYFHITTAYAILRHNGVDVGKKDYLGEMPFQK